MVIDNRPSMRTRDGVNDTGGIRIPLSSSPLTCFLLNLVRFRAEFGRQTFLMHEQV